MQQDLEKIHDLDKKIGIIQVQLDTVAKEQTEIKKEQAVTALQINSLEALNRKVATYSFVGGLFLNYILEKIGIHIKP